MGLNEHSIVGLSTIGKSITRLARSNIVCSSSFSSSNNTDIPKLCDEYNSSNDGNLLNPFLSYRNLSLRDKNKLSIYENLVRFVYDHIEIMTSKESHNSKNNTENYNPSEPAEHYMASAYIAELLQNRPDLLEKVLQYKNGLKISLVKEITDKECGGYYIPKDHRIIIGNGKFQIFDSNKDGYNIVVHELGHALDFIDDESGDGIPVNMTPEQIVLYEKVRDNLFERYHNYRKGLSEEKVKEINKEHYDPATGLTNYSFKDKKEFFADTVAMFYENPSYLKKISPELYDIYVNYFKINPLKDLEKKPSIIKTLLIATAWISVAFLLFSMFF